VIPVPPQWSADAKARAYTMLETFVRDAATVSLAPATTRWATSADAEHVAERLRAQDTAELLAMNLDPREAVIQSHKRAIWCDVAELQGRPVAIFGVCRSQDDPALGLPWLVGTEDMTGLGSQFVRGCRPVVDRMLATCPALVNIVHRENRVAQRWLSWLGFRFVHLPAPLQSPFIGFWQAKCGYEQLALDWLSDRGFNTGGKDATHSSR